MYNYTKIQKFLHDLVLNKKIINRSLFEIEKIIFLKKIDITKRSHIFITGMPRSGTTSLLNFLFSSNQYASLTYNNMPFLLSPNLSKFMQDKNISKKERLHGDGVYYNNNSPEAFDEIFFKNSEVFVKNELTNYIQLILSNNNKEKYLSKNNLNYTRIDLINSLLPNSKFLILIREPSQQVYSLFNQHLNFSKLQKKDDFIKRYMNYLGHNEFGLDHKSWNNPINFKDFKDINYWLEQWYLFYKTIYDKYKSYKNCRFIVYEKLYNTDYVKKILKDINIEKSNKLNLNYFINSNKKKINLKFENELFEKSIHIYNKFLQLK